MDRIVAAHAPPLPNSSEHLARAHDALASVYDAYVPDDRWIREELRSRYRALFRPGEHVLDVGCGTGAEALFLAEGGLEVTCIDVSPLMVEETRRKAESRHLDHRVHASVCDLRDLNRWPAESVDGIISTYSALSMVGSFPDFSVAAARLLRPGGRMLLHLNNRFYLYYYLQLALTGRWRGAQRLRRIDAWDVTIAGRPMVSYVSSPIEAYHHGFEPQFELTAAYGLGVIRPHFDPTWFPRVILRGLGRVERSVRGRQPFAGWGMFFVLELTKR